MCATFKVCGTGGRSRKSGNSAHGLFFVKSQSGILNLCVQLLNGFWWKWKKHVFPLLAFKSKFRISPPLLGAGSQQKGPRNVKVRGRTRTRQQHPGAHPKQKHFLVVHSCRGNDMASPSKRGKLCSFVETLGLWSLNNNWKPHALTLQFEKMEYDEMYCAWMDLNASCKFEIQSLNPYFND